MSLYYSPILIIFFPFPFFSAVLSSVPISVAAAEGVADATEVGCVVALDGCTVGAADGCEVVGTVGCIVGISVGDSEGSWSILVGLEDGEGVS